MYCKVYAPNGEPFEVSRDRADKLVLEEGWTQTKPEFVPVAPVVDEPVVDVEREFTYKPKSKSSGRKKKKDYFSDV